MIKTKIIATLGPASCHPDTLRALIDAGTNVFRINFSHGSFADHGKTLKTLRQLQTDSKHITAVMGDLCGPKIRTSRIEPDRQMLREGDQVTIVNSDQPGNAHRFGTNYQQFVQDVKPGHRVLIDDGQILLQAISQDDNETVCRVLIGGPIKSRKGINLPDSTVSAPSITEHDWKCVDWAIENKLDFLALSFVRTPSELIRLKDYIHQKGSNIKVVSKIEKPEAVEHLEEILRASDAVLVARGDLGVEMDLAQVPLIQKRITNMCRELGKPVIVATQMLQSMIESATPTRAEVSDVANAIMDLTDAVMLSGETAVGKYPRAAITMINRIAQATEAYMDQIDGVRPRVGTEKELALIAALARSVAQIIDDTNAKLVVAWSHTGVAARLLSKARIDVPIIVFTPSKLTGRQMCFHYGVVPFCRPAPADIKELAEIADQVILENRWAEPNDQIILLAGRPLTAPGTPNALMVHKVSIPPK